MIIRRDVAKSVDFGDLRIRDYTAALGISASFAVIGVPPGVKHGRSWSTRSDKYYYVLAGTVEFTLESDVFTLDEGDLCYVKRGCKFDYRNNSGGVVQLALVHTPSFDIDSEVFE